MHVLNSTVAVARQAQRFSLSNNSRLLRLDHQRVSNTRILPRSASGVADSRLPRIAQSSIWEQIVPRALRERSWKSTQAAKKKPLNPASYFIWIYLFIGSQAIRILGLQNEHQTYMRRADLKIEQLREVVRKLQAGEPVDVEGSLGTGDELQELEWEEALKEIEKEERTWQENKKTKWKQDEVFAQEMQDASPVNKEISEPVHMPANIASQQPPYTTPGFY